MGRHGTSPAAASGMRHVLLRVLVALSALHSPVSSGHDLVPYSNAAPQAANAAAGLLAKRRAAPVRRWMGMQGWNEDGEFTFRPSLEQLIAQAVARAGARSPGPGSSSDAADVRVVSRAGRSSRRALYTDAKTRKARHEEQVRAESKLSKKIRLGASARKSFYDRPLLMRSQKRHRRKSWLDHLAQQIKDQGGQPQTGRILDELREKGATSVGELEDSISQSGLQMLNLDAFYDFNVLPQNDSWPVPCPSAPECPEFRSCGIQSIREPPVDPHSVEDSPEKVNAEAAANGRARKVDLGALSACTVPSLSSATSWQPTAPLNCPRIPCDSPMCDNIPVFDPKCSQQADDTPSKKWQSSIFTLKNVYVNAHGQPFNSTRWFDRSGCASADEFSYAKGYPVIHYETLVSLAHWSTSSFYHGLIELLPMFFLFSHAPNLFQAHPIVVEIFTMEFLHQVASFLLGLDVTTLNVRVLSPDYLFHAKTLVQPVFQQCGSPVAPLWREMRRQHLVAKGGLPMFNPDWTPRRPYRPAPIDGLAPDDWVVVLVQRLGSRSLVQHKTVLGILKTLFPPERVEVFKGDMDIADAKELFNRAVLVVAVHGAALTNMIFAPFNAAVVELRPRDYMNACFHHLAQVCDLKYFLVLCDGDRESSTTCSMRKVRAAIKAAKKAADLLIPSS